MVHTVALTFIRHGTTLNNRLNKYQGWLDTPLLPAEKERLRQKRKQYPQPNRVFSSDLIRSQETAHLLFPRLQAEVTANFRELHFGDFEGKSYHELKDKEAYQRWLNENFQIAPPNGESFQTFKNRLQVGWESLKGKFSENVNEIAIVTHGGVIRYYLEQFAPIEKAFWEWNVPLGGGYRLITSIEKLRRDERCISLSEVPLTAKQNG